LLACIVKDGMRAGDIVDRTRADAGDRHVRFDDSGSCQCVSHKIEMKISARVSISIFHATLPVKGARRGCHVPVMGGDRAIGGHTPTNRHSFIAGARSADRLGERWAVPSRGEEPQGESHDPDEASKINASPRVFEGVFHHSGCDCSQ
jgi:hypothetical protein